MIKKGIILMALGILGIIGVYAFDIIVGKPVNDITGLKSISALVICAIAIILGLRLVLKRKKTSV